LETLDCIADSIHNTWHGSCDDRCNDARHGARNDSTDAVHDITDCVANAGDDWRNHAIDYGIDDAGNKWCSNIGNHSSHTTDKTTNQSRAV
jgi:hypothetical protein